LAGFFATVISNVTVQQEYGNGGQRGQQSAVFRPLPINDAKMNSWRPHLPDGSLLQAAVNCFIFVVSEQGIVFLGD